MKTVALTAFLVFGCAVVHRNVHSLHMGHLCHPPHLKLSGQRRRRGRRMEACMGKSIVTQTWCDHCTQEPVTARHGMTTVTRSQHDHRTQELTETMVTHTKTSQQDQPALQQEAIRDLRISMGVGAGMGRRSQGGGCAERCLREWGRV